MKRELKPGMWLHASCNDEWYGPILRVGVDANGAHVIDLPIPDINEFLDCERFGEFQKGECLPSLMRAECGPVIFRDLQYKWPEQLFPDRLVVECNTPGNGCYRCTELFSVHEARN